MNCNYQIEELVPHSGSMCLLDSLVSHAKGTLTAAVKIREKSQFSTASGVPSWVGIEYMGQAIAAYAGVLARQSDKPIKIGLLVSARNYRSNVPFFKTGESLQVRIEEYSEEVNGLQTFICSIKGDEADVAARLNVYMPEDATEFLEQAIRE